MLLQQCGGGPDTVLLLYVGRLVRKKSAFARGGVPGARRSAGQELSHADRGEGMGLDELKRLARNGAGSRGVSWARRRPGGASQLYAIASVCPPESTRAVRDGAFGGDGLRTAAGRAEPGRCSFLRESGKRWLADPTPDASPQPSLRRPCRHSAQEKLQAALVTADSFRWENVTDSLLRLYRISTAPLKAFRWRNHPRSSRPTPRLQVATLCVWLQEPRRNFLVPPRAGISCQPSPRPRPIRGRRIRGQIS